MDQVEKIHAVLEGLQAERAQLSQSWYLQNCWVTQSKPGGTARTTHKYWQVRSRQPIFDGKTVKHLKADEVEAYKAAIVRGRQIKRLDRQIEKLQQQLAKLVSRPDLSNGAAVDEPSLSSLGLLTRERSQRVKESVSALMNLAEQERLVQEVLSNSRALRSMLRQSIERGRKLGEANIKLRT